MASEGEKERRHSKYLELDVALPGQEARGSAGCCRLSDDKMDGAEFAKRINEQVKIGERVGKRLLPEDLRFFKSEGALLGRERAALTRKKHALITPDVAERITKDYKESGLSQRNLAEVYGVSQSYVSRIVSRQLRA
ncbi:MAG: helix-turn-helix domain-containing protein [Nitrososphaerales archaeon]|nr:helix-turn-helix domain-containing protein [Nitrososphaerales archaeon]